MMAQRMGLPQRPACLIIVAMQVCVFASPSGAMMIVITFSDRMKLRMIGEKVDRMFTGSKAAPDFTLFALHKCKGFTPQLCTISLKKQTFSAILSDYFLPFGLVSVYNNSWHSHDQSFLGRKGRG
jgi:hypothetical protein